MSAFLVSTRKGGFGSPKNDTGKDDLSQILEKAVFLHRNGELVKAERLYQKILSTGHAHPICASNLATIYRQRNEFTKAEELLQLAIRLSPGFSDGYSNLGLLLMDLDRLDEAYNSFAKALDINPSKAVYLYNMGTCLRASGNSRKALFYLEQAISSEGAKHQWGYELPAYLLECGEQSKAVDALLQLSGNKQRGHRVVNVWEYVFRNYPTCIDLLQLEDAARICQLLASSQEIHFQLVADLFYRYISFGDIEGLLAYDANDLVAQKESEISQLFADRIFTSILRHSYATDLRIEHLLKKLRTSLALEYLSQNYLNPSRKQILQSIAIQCVNNGYIYALSKGDTDLLVKLQTQIENYSHFSDAESALVLLACFIPLAEDPRLSDLARIVLPKSEEWSDFLSRHISEPLAAKDLSRTLSSGVDISDEIVVREQYESSPYPMWIAAAHTFEQRIAPYDSISSQIRPAILDKKFKVDKPRVLVAGCGTGLQVSSLLSWDVSSIDALDISANSLGYANMKYKQLGIQDINFIHGDLIQYCSSGQKYDVIECCGVLHHLPNPLIGLLSLVKALRENGIIKLAVYSSLARRSVLEAQALAEGLGYGKKDLNEIRKFRDFLFSKSLHRDLGDRLSRFHDAYNLHMFRDLCFNGMETNYSIDQLSRLLAASGLRFAGFCLPKFRLEHFCDAYPNPDMLTHLPTWEAYEKENPDCFASMYEFFAVKA